MENENKPIVEAQPSQTPAPENPVTPPAGTPGASPAQTPGTPPANPNPSKSLEEKNAELESQNSQLFARANKAEEREKELKDELNKIKSQQQPSEYEYSYQDNRTDERVDSLENKLNQIEEDRKLGEIYAKYADLKEKAGDFQEYIKKYPQVELESVAKLFMSEQGLLGNPERPGLERATGGNRVPPTSGTISTDDAKRLRETDSKKYRQLLKEGKIQIAN